MNRVFLCVAAISLAMISAPKTADACSCGKSTLEQSFDEATDVVRVRPLSNRIVKNPENPDAMGVRLIRVVAKRVFKGRVRRGQTITIRTSPSGKSCGLTITKKHGPEVLFLRRDKSGKLHGSTCQKQVDPKQAEYAELKKLAWSERRVRRQQRSKAKPQRAQ